MRKLILLSLSLFLFFPLASLAQVNTPSGGTPSALSAAQNVVSPLQYGAKWDWKFVYDAGTTINSKTVTCPSSDCNFTAADVGKMIFATNMTANGATLGFIPGSVIMTANPLPKIVTVNSATSVTTDTNASATCTSAVSNLCIIAWGTQDDTSAINQAMAAAWRTPGVCLPIVLPSGAALISSGILYSTGPQLSSACGGDPSGTASLSGIDTTQSGPMVYGQGSQSTILIPSPNFDFTTGAGNSCGGGSTNTVCIGGTYNMAAHDFAINGLGQEINSAESVILVQLQGSPLGGACTGSTGFNLTFSTWAGNATGSIGLDMGNGACGDPTYSNIISESFGAMNCKLHAAGLTVATFYGLACFGSQGLTATMQSDGGGVLDTNGSFFGGLANPGADVIINNNSSPPFIYNSTGDTFKDQTAAANTTAVDFTSSIGPIFAKFVGDYFSIPSTTTAGSQVFLQNSGAQSTINLRNSYVVATGTNNKIFNQASGNTFQNGQGNTFVNGSVASTFSGTALSEPAESGTVTCATSAATITFKSTYLLAPLYIIQDRTTAGAVTQTSLNTTTLVVGCPGASDVLNYQITPNPF